MTKYPGDEFSAPLSKRNGFVDIVFLDEQVLDKVGGYIIANLFRRNKLNCQDCRDAVLQDQQGILVSERQFERADCMQLPFCSDSLQQFLFAAEAIFRQRVAITAHLPAIGQQLRHAIKLGAPRLDCCHEEAATDAIITLVLRAASFLL